MDHSLRYSSDRVAIVREARKSGLSDEQILLALCRSESSRRRREIVREWAAPLGLTEQEALDLAKRLALIKR
jgi:hypothetical protein